jgi:hypothetical protein
MIYDVVVFYADPRLSLIGLCILVQGRRPANFLIKFRLETGLIVNFEDRANLDCDLIRNSN